MKERFNLTNLLIRTLTIIGLIVMFAVPAFVIAQAEDESLEEGFLNLIPASVAIGESVRVSGSCQANNAGASKQDVALVHRDKLWTTITTDERGNFEETLSVPKSAPVKELTVYGKCSRSVARLEAKLNIVSNEDEELSGGAQSELSDASADIEITPVTFFYGLLGSTGLAAGVTQLDDKFS